MHSIINFLNPEWAARQQQQADDYNQRRFATATFVDWTPNIKWQLQMYIKAASYATYSLFKVKPTPELNPNKVKDGHYVDSPTEQFRYTENVLKPGRTIQTWCGSKIGDVMFDKDIIIPALYEKDDYIKAYRRDPWMSLTPAEVMSLRGGTRRAKGRVIVAGLGLGHQLLEVDKRKQVKEIVLLEQNQELVDWLLPILRPRLTKPLKVVVGDAMLEIPRLKADVALVDIFKGYGNNHYEIDDLRKMSFEIGHIWGWGTATIKGDIW